MDGARENYTTMINDEESRKAIVDEFVKQVGLSKAAGNTYCQLIKDQHLIFLNQCFSISTPVS